MPAGCEADESYQDYILGTRDGVAKTPGLGRVYHRRSAGDHRPHRPRVRHGQAGGPLPRLRDAEAGLRRAGGPGRLCSGGHHRQRRHPRRMGGRHRPSGARRRALVDRFPGGRQSRQGRDPELPLDGGRRPGQGDGPRGRRRGGRPPRFGHQAHLGRGQQLPRQPARQRQPDGAHPRGREARRIPHRPGQLPDADRPVRRHPPPGLHPVRDVGRGGRLEVRGRGPPDAEGRRAALRNEKRLRHLRRDRREARRPATPTPRAATSAAGSPGRSTITGARGSRACRRSTSSKPRTPASIRCR